MPRIRPRSRSRLVPAGALTVAALALAGCAAEATPREESPEAAVEVSNCDYPVAFPAAPERVLTIKSTATEMLLALGLEDRIIGTAFLDGPVPERWADAAADLTEVSDRMPGEEAALELAPDLIYAGWESAFTADGVGERDELAALGVASYVSPAACRSAEQPEKLTFEHVFAEIDEVARIFRVDATELIAEQRAALEAIQRPAEPVTALWWSSGTDTPYVGGDIGSPQMVLEAAGLSNIVSGVEATWTSLNWEAIIDADPAVIVLVDADWNTARHKIEYLTTNPATATLDAVVNERFVVIPFAASEAGVRSAEAATSVAEQVADLGL